MTPEAASPMDEPWIRQLLTLCGLPQEDLTPQHLRHFFVMKEKGELIGVVGLDVLGQVGLLRSLAVDPGYRKQGSLHHQRYKGQLNFKVYAQPAPFVWGSGLKVENHWLLSGLRSPNIIDRNR